jgi:hypothetical protein
MSRSHEAGHPVHDAGISARPSGLRAPTGAQAGGGLQTLREAGLAAVRVRLPAGDPAGAITRLQEQL